MSVCYEDTQFLIRMMSKSNQPYYTSFGEGVSTSADNNEVTRVVTFEDQTLKVRIFIISY